jgi:hypothetical protein
MLNKSYFAKAYSFWFQKESSQPLDFSAFGTIEPKTIEELAMFHLLYVGDRSKVKGLMEVQPVDYLTCEPWYWWKKWTPTNNHLTIDIATDPTKNNITHNTRA